LYHEKNPEQVASDSFIIENTMAVIFFKCLTIIHRTLPKDNDGFELPIAKLKENTLLNMP